MKEPVDHILRPRLPWRSPNEPAITECGYDASKVKTLTRAEFFQREKELGQRRCVMLTCMTCADTARRWGTWEDDPRLAVQREAEWERQAPYYRRCPSDERGTVLKDELVAIAGLIEAHRDDFDARILEIRQRRKWNEKKAAMTVKAPPRREPGGL
ncbi:MAG TPA: hypothetical protein VNY06_01150 [Methylocella sp.]|jgi:hypothetical protein|nr:hypothetical protein [Methylocella sp.]